MSPQRLSLARLPSPFVRSAGIAPGVVGPAVDSRGVSIGIVHFGIGAFHRSHQAVFTEDAAAAVGATGWGILGVTGRTDSVVQQLQPQDCLYGVLQKDVTSTSLRIIGSVREVAWPGRDSERVVEVMASEHTHIATLTITEKGYLRSTDGAIDLSLPAVQDDLALVTAELLGKIPDDASRTAIGLLVRGLARRFRTNQNPFTVLCCDNVVHNGEMVKQVIISLASAVSKNIAGDTRSAFLTWLQEGVAFPSSMVDRITPAVTADDQREALEMLGLVDDALVVAEPFSQWVIEDSFAGPRPEWERAGVTMTTDVQPFERAKLRILNATHSLLAYVGQLSGYETIAETVADDGLREIAQLVLDDDILPSLENLPGLDLREYRDSVLARFANPALAHTTLQVAMDGSQKLPNRILGTVVDRMDAGAMPDGLAFAVAAWIAFIASTIDDGAVPVRKRPPLDDPMAAELTAAVGSAKAIETEPHAVLDRLFSIRSVFPAPLVASREFRDAVVAQFSEVRRATASPRSSNG